VIEETARWLTSDEASEILRLAALEPDPASLAAADRLRRLTTPERAAAALSQVALRRRAVTKFGDAAAGMFFTPAGLEQATRPAVSRRRAVRFLELGVTSVVDVGCGIGADAASMRAAGSMGATGLDVSGIEIDPVTAVFARANAGCEVVVGDAEELFDWTDARAVFCDPARRTSRGRTWRVSDFSPSWDFVTRLLDSTRVACVKLGPGLPTSLIPDAVEAEWVSDAGQLVECALWAAPSGVVPNRRRAVVDGAELFRDGPAEPVGVGELCAFVYEPDGAVAAAGLIGELASTIGGVRVHREVSYLTAPTFVATPFATAFEVLEVMPWSEKTLRAWVCDNRIGTLEIKKRGLQVDPAALRRRLRPAGPASATIIGTPTPRGAVAIVARRVGR
jgi:SAM-dependent methyltransferase